MPAKDDKGSSKGAEEKPKDAKNDQTKKADDHKSEPAKAEDQTASKDEGKKDDASKAKDNKQNPSEGDKEDDKSKPDAPDKPTKSSAEGKPEDKDGSKDRNAGQRLTVPVEGNPEDTMDSSEDLVRSATQKARRLSIRSKGRPSIVTETVLPQSNTIIKEEDVIDTIQADNVWDLAVKMKQLQTETADPDEGQLETTLIVLGGEQAGKSTLVARLLDSEEAPRKTLGLDYTYARHAGAGVGKDVCQIWELGGGMRHLSLLDTPVSADRLSDTACLIVVDLSRPETILPTVEQCCDYMQKLIDKKLKEAAATGIMVRNLLQSNLDSLLPSDHPDRAKIQPLPIPLALVGGKYDKFEPMDTVDKKVVVEAMRWAAHRHFAHLLFFSSQDVALGSRARELLSHMAFRTDHRQKHSTDVQKPIQVTAGADNYKAIAGGGDGLPLEIVQSHVSDKWPPAKEKEGVPDDPAKDTLFAEPEVDSLRAEKVKELDRMRQDLERRRKMALEREAAEKQKRAAPVQVNKEQAAAAAADFLERHHSVIGSGKPADKHGREEKKPAGKTEHKPAAKSDAKHPAKTEAKPAAKHTAKSDGKTSPNPESVNAKEAAKKHEKAPEKAETKPAVKKVPDTHAKADAKKHNNQASKK